MNRQGLVWSVAAIAVLLALAMWLLSGPADPPQPVTAQLSKPAVSSAPAWAPRPAVSAQSIVLSAEDRDFIATLRGKFAPAIQGKHAQIKAIEQVIAYLMEHYPDDWQTRVREFLAQLFPDLADQLYAQFEKLTGFNDWLREHRAELMQMAPLERRRALWEARRAAFGADAEAIWQGELRNEKLVASLTAVDQAQGKTPEEKLAQFLSTVQEAYGEEAPLFIAHSQSELLNRFLSVDSVQADLNALPRTEQHAVLRRVRTTLGLDEEALKRWDTLDVARDQAWDAGQSYQLQRAAVLAQYTGEEQARRLSALQEQTFGSEAEAIRAEEAAGFFRYEHPRRLGRE